MSRFTRRRFIYGSTAALASLSLGDSFLFGKDKLPKPDKSGIDHIVVAMVENRSFDHLLGWLPGAERPAGRPHLHGPRRRRLRDVSAGARLPGLRPSGSRPFLRAADAWSTTSAPATAGCAPARTTVYAIGYYRQEDLPFLGQAAPDWTVCSRYFASIMAPTYPEPASTSTPASPTAWTTPRPLHAADDLGPARRRGPRRALLLLGYSLPRALGDRSTPGSRAPTPSSSPTARPEICPRSPSSIRPFAGAGDRDLVGRSPPRRHPRRRVLARPRPIGPSRPGRTGSTPSSSSTSTSGEASSTTSPPPLRQRRRIPSSSSAASACRASSSSPHRPPRLRRRRRLRPHVDPADDRVAVRAWPPSRRATTRRTIWPRCLDFKAHGSAAPPDYDVAPILPTACPTT